MHGGVGWLQPGGLEAVALAQAAGMEASKRLSSDGAGTPIC